MCYEVDVTNVRSPSLPLPLRLRVLTCSTRSNSSDLTSSENMCVSFFFPAPLHSGVLTLLNAVQPELVIAFIVTACHVLSDILLFLVKLNFR